MFSGEGVSAPFLSRISRTVERPTQNWHDPGESDCLIKTKHSDGRKVDADGMWFLPSALNVNVKKFKEARVNGGSNYDSLKVAKCLVI